MDADSSFCCIGGSAGCKPRKDTGSSTAAAGYKFKESVWMIAVLGDSDDMELLTCPKVIDYKENTYDDLKKSGVCTVKETMKFSAFWKEMRGLLYDYKFDQNIWTKEHIRWVLNKNKIYTNESLTDAAKENAYTFMVLSFGVLTKDEAYIEKNAKNTQANGDSFITTNVPKAQQNQQGAGNGQQSSGGGLSSMEQRILKALNDFDDAYSHNDQARKAERESCLSVTTPPQTNWTNLMAHYYCQLPGQTPPVRECFTYSVRGTSGYTKRSYSEAFDWCSTEGKDNDKPLTWVKDLDVFKAVMVDQETFPNAETIIDDFYKGRSQKRDIR